jgi:hypothetical protein
VPESYRVRQFASEGIVVHGRFDPPSVMAPRLVGFGSDHKRALDGFARLGCFAARISEGSTGVVTANRRGGFPRVRHQLGEADRRKLLRATGLAAELCFAAGAVEVFPGLRSRPSLSSVEEAHDVAASDAAIGDLALTGCHPMGTARMGADPSRGVTSPSGEVFGAGGLYVADASLFPTSCRADPQLTVMALALRLGEELSAGLGAPSATALPLRLAGDSLRLHSTTEGDDVRREGAGAGLGAGEREARDGAVGGDLVASTRSSPERDQHRPQARPSRSSLEIGDAGRILRRVREGREGCPDRSCRPACRERVDRPIWKPAP